MILLNKKAIGNSNSLFIMWFYLLFCLLAITIITNPKHTRTIGTITLDTVWKMFIVPSLFVVYIPMIQDISVSKKHHPATVIPKYLFFRNL